MDHLDDYRKSITALVTSVIGWAGVVVASPSTNITGPEWLFLAVGIATSLGVYSIPNGTAEIEE